MSFTVKALGQLLVSSWRRPKPTFVKVPPNAIKIFEQTPPAWARWGLVLVSVDIMVATSAVDIIWNTWTMPVPESVEPKDSKGEMMASITPEAPVKGNFLQVIPPGQVLQPEWKRAASCALFLVTGFTVAGAILAARSRVLRTVTFARAEARTPSRIFIQSASHPMKFGIEYPIKDCALLPWSQDQMMIEVKGSGKWVLDMRGGARIAGASAAMDKTIARSTMLRTWKDIGGSTTSISNSQRFY